MFCVPRDTWRVDCFDLADVQVKTYDERKVKNSRRPGTRTRHPTQFLFLKYVPTASASGTPCAGRVDPESRLAIRGRVRSTVYVHHHGQRLCAVALRVGYMHRNQVKQGRLPPEASVHCFTTPNGNSESPTTHVPDFLSKWPRDGEWNQCPTACRNPCRRVRAMRRGFAGLGSGKRQRSSIGKSGGEGFTHGMDVDRTRAPLVSKTGHAGKRVAWALRVDRGNSRCRCWSSRRCRDASLM